MFRQVAYPSNSFHCILVGIHVHYEVKILWYCITPACTSLLSSVPGFTSYTSPNGGKPVWGFWLTRKMNPRARQFPRSVRTKPCHRGHVSITSWTGKQTDYIYSQQPWGIPVISQIILVSAYHYLQSVAFYVLGIDAIVFWNPPWVLTYQKSVQNKMAPFLARWLTSARAYRIGGRKLCPSVCLYVKRYLLLQFCTDYNQTWINMIWAVAAKTLLSQIFHNWRRIEVNCVYISHCKWYRTSAGMPACIPNRRCCAGQCAGQ